MRGVHLCVLVPGLSRALVACGDKPTNELIRSLIRSGTRVDAGGESFASQALSLFGHRAFEKAGCSFAAVSYLGLIGRRPVGACLRLDPGHLQPRRAQLYLVAGDPLALHQAEAASLVSDISNHYQSMGWTISAPHTDQWFLELHEDPEISTTPIAQAAGRDIDALLPTGKQAAVWHARMNEIQMLLHQSTVNAVREDEDRYTINTVWPWGEGRLPSASRADWQRVWSNEAFTRGLARLGDTALQSVPEDAEQLMNDFPLGSGLLVLGDAWSEARRGDPAYAHRESMDLETRWWRPLRSALRRGELHSLTIADPARGRVTIRDVDVRPWRLLMKRLSFDS